MGATAARFLLIGLGGFLGTGLRYGLNGLVSRHFGETFPLGTLVVNVSGSFALGVVFVATGPDSPWLVSATTRQVLMAGILGGYTTFSSFSVQTLTLLREGSLAAALGNVALSVGCGVLAAWLGEELARAIIL
ncbi:MAG TPA: fluoride efflux transporter CrcB [Candidatus Polarisedimenticolaceae bacterium]|nr:fluoride efflux transporter CrcB [Candidatus Polarisedimenticolaceae bacterium]